MMLALLLNQLRNYTRPTRLVTRSNPRAVIAVEIFVKGTVAAPVRVVLEGPFADPYNTGDYPVVIKLAYNALVDIDKMSTEEIFYWRGMAKAHLEDWDGAAQDLRRAHLLNPNFLPAGS